RGAGRDAVRVGGVGRPGRRRRRTVGHRSDLSEGVRDRARRVCREERPGLQAHRGEAGGRFFAARGSAGGADPDAGERGGLRSARVRPAAIIPAVVAALALQTTLARVFVQGAGAVDLVLVAGVYVGRASGPGSRLLAGTFAGLVQDALSSRVLGIGGLAKTIVGFLAGIIGTQFIVSQPVPRFVVFFGSSVLDLVVSKGLYALLDLR